MAYKTLCNLAQLFYFMSHYSSPHLWDPATLLAFSQTLQNHIPFYLLQPESLSSFEISEGTLFTFTLIQHPPHPHQLQFYHITLSIFFKRGFTVSSYTLDLLILFFDFLHLAVNFIYQRPSLPVSHCISCA